MTASSWAFYSVAAGGPAALEVRDELELGDVTIVDRLKGAGSFSSSIPLYAPSATRANLDTENTLIVATRDDSVVGVAQLLEVSRGMGSDDVTLAGDGYWSLVRSRVIRNAAGMSFGTLDAGEVRFEGVDQFRIVDDLIAHMQSIESLGITVDYSALSGVTRDRSYEADKGKTIGEAIEQLADVDDGFDWALDVGGTVDNLELTLRLHYPMRGRNTGYLFELSTPDPDSDTARSSGSSNVLDYSIAETSRELVTRFTAIGPGEGASQLVEHVADPNMLGVVPLREAAGAWLDVTEPATLRAHAARRQQLNGRRSLLVTLKLDPNAVPVLGSYILGDTASIVSIDDGWSNIAGPFRIMSRTIEVPKGGAESVTVELAELGRF